MSLYESVKADIQQDGFAIVNNLFSEAAITEIVTAIKAVSIEKESFRKSKDLFAIRQFLKELPQVKTAVFTNELLTLISAVSGKDYFVVKSIYFDKPPASNWFVSWHQDLTISVKEKLVAEGYGPWTVKQNQYAVQPPVSVLENIFTIRIHLDDTDENNGALKVISASHTAGIVRPETVEEKYKKEIICNVQKGGVMLMKPLLLHASNKTTNQKRRRVIHIECSNQQLPQPLQWSEYLSLQ